jgi:hypothetical protein
MGLGFIDVYGIGTGADLINAALQWSDGQRKEAATSLLAAIPVAGTLTRVSAPVLRFIMKNQKAKEVLTKLVRNQEEVVSFIKTVLPEGDARVGQAIEAVNLIVGKVQEVQGTTV